MRWLPEPVERLLNVALVGELTVVGRGGRPITHPLIPALSRGEDLPPLLDPVQQEARAHQARPARLALPQRPDRHQGQPRPRDDPGDGAPDRGRPALRLGAAHPSALAPEGAVDRRLPQGARRAAALLRTRGHRDHAGALPVLGRRPDRSRRGREPRAARRGRLMAAQAPTRPGSVPAHRAHARPTSSALPATRTSSSAGWPTTAIRSASPPASRPMPPRARSGLRRRRWPSPPTARSGCSAATFIQFRVATTSAATCRSGAAPARRAMAASWFAPDRVWGWDETETPFFEYAERSVPQSRRYLEQLSQGEGPDHPPAPQPILAGAADDAPSLPVGDGGAGAARDRRGGKPRRIHVVDGAADPHRRLVRPPCHQRHERHLRHALRRR